MWTVVYMARSREMAEKLKNALEQAALLVKIKPITSEISKSENCYEVLVPEAEVGEAHNIIIEIGF